MDNETHQNRDGNPAREQAGGGRDFSRIRDAFGQPEPSESSGTKWLESYGKPGDKPSGTTARSESPQSGGEGTEGRSKTTRRGTSGRTAKASGNGSGSEAREPARGTTEAAGASTTSEERERTSAQPEPARTPQEESKERGQPAVRVTGGRPKVVPIFKGGLGKEGGLQVDFVKNAYQMLYEMPALSGYGPWWSLTENEAVALAEPTTRVLNRLSPSQQELMSRYFDPLALVMTIAIITMPRIKQTQLYMEHLEKERQTEVLRERLSRSSASAPDQIRGRANRENPNGEAPPDAEDVIPGSYERVKNAFDIS